MTYTAVASGARGILYWSLSRLRNAREGSDVTAADHWERLKSVTLELKQLMPLLTAETPETIQTKDRVVAMVKSDGKDTYVILANYERKPTETVLDVPGISDATAVGVFGEESARVKNGKLAISLEPIESRCVPGGDRSGHIRKGRIATKNARNTKKRGRGGRA